MSLNEKKGAAAKDGDYLSIIVPAYNEEKRIVETLNRLKAYMKDIRYRYEILVVDDGSDDGTRELVKKFIFRNSSMALRLIEERHRGKGHAVKTGILAAKGRFVLFMDADASVPMEKIADFTSCLEQDEKDIVIASRDVSGANRYNEPVIRHIASRAFNLLVRAFLMRGLSDTQCGFKAFQGRVARDLFQRACIDGFSFDVEILYLAQRRGKTIGELPVEWRYRSSSRMRLWRDVYPMFLDVFRIRINHWRGVYKGVHAERS